MTIFAPGLLDGKVAIVTGGGTGIGRAIALELARAGADLVVAARRREPLEGTAAEADEMGRRCLVVPTNVRDPEQVKALVAATLAEYGHLDILVNNAGGQFFSPTETLSLGGWSAVIDLNLNGTFNCIRAVSEPMIAQRWGKIVTIIIGATRRAAPNLAHSGAARAGVENLTRSLAVEWAHHNIQINCVSPVVITEGVHSNYKPQPGLEERLRHSIPAGRLGTPQEVGWLVTFLASPAADYITGEHIAIDGGFWLATPLQFGGG